MAFFNIGNRSWGVAWSYAGDLFAFAASTRDVVKSQQAFKQILRGHRKTMISKLCVLCARYMEGIGHSQIGVIFWRHI